MNKNEYAVDISKRVLEMNKNMRVKVNIPHDEADRLIVNRLIDIRNSIGNKKYNKSHLDKTLRIFLTEKEFKKYVEGNVKIKP